eukprot:gene14917-20970_t
MALFRFAFVRHDADPLLFPQGCLLFEIDRVDDLRDPEFTEYMRNRLFNTFADQANAPDDLHVYATWRDRAPQAGGFSALWPESPWLQFLRKLLAYVLLVDPDIDGNTTVGKYNSQHNCYMTQRIPKRTKKASPPTPSAALAQALEYLTSTYRSVREDIVLRQCFALPCDPALERHMLNGVGKIYLFRKMARSPDCRHEFREALEYAAEAATGFAMYTLRTRLYNMSLEGAAMQSSLLQTSNQFRKTQITSDLLELMNKKNNDFKKKGKVPRELAKATGYFNKWAECHIGLNNPATREAVKVMTRMADNSLKEARPPGPTTWGQCHDLFMAAEDLALDCCAQDSDTTTKAPLSPYQLLLPLCRLRNIAPLKIKVIATVVRGTATIPAKDLALDCCAQDSDTTTTTTTTKAPFPPSLPSTTPTLPSPQYRPRQNQSHRHSGERHCHDSSQGPGSGLLCPGF